MRLDLLREKRTFPDVIESMIMDWMLRKRDEGSISTLLKILGDYKELGTIYTNNLQATGN